jgi:prepilin-type N-terminal cleavage/methylation domain-containing protein
MEIQKEEFMCFVLQQKGFSLIELVVVVAIFAIGSAIAVPNFIDLGKRADVKRNAIMVKDALFKARMEAVKSNESMVFQVDSDGESYLIKGGVSGNLIGKHELQNIDIETNCGSEIVWNTRGNTNDACTINLVGQGGKYNVVISSVGNIRISKP